jgi:hypothetical protein
MTTRFHLISNEIVDTDDPNMAIDRGLASTLKDPNAVLRVEVDGFTYPTADEDGVANTVLIPVRSITYVEKV